MKIAKVHTSLTYISYCKRMDSVQEENASSSEAGPCGCRDKSREHVVPELGSRRKRKSPWVVLGHLLGMGDDTEMGRQWFS